MRDSWNRRWGDDTYHPGFEIEESDPSVRRAVEDGWFSRGMRVLDIGCGTGHNAAWLAEQGLEAVGIDFSSHAIERAHWAFDGSPRLTFRVVDVVEPGAFSETFDALVDRGCFHGIQRSDRTAYAGNLESWSSANARLLLLVRNRERGDARVVATARKVLEPGFLLLSSQSADLARPNSKKQIPAMAMRFVRSA